ncbi:PREDICTED: glycine receptor subunit alpha-1-like [Priapulus caudatus]|uniref:Glycine receptor subunit alpha-1-like n=1 Tax=Priapulus caudatus TaxID=37621 RepID=A0ABM1E0C0_PRICU|nr:PREDICTED: glycine receptor subunit alpha-1-like [Priapulus caudatus]
MANSKWAATHTVTRPNILLWFYPNGTVLYTIRITSTFACQMDLRSYPFDTQRCFIQVGSYNSGHSLYGFILISVNQIRGNFSCLKMMFIFKREFGYHLSQSYLPCVFLVICSWVSFWLHIDAIPARISLGVTTFLTIYTQSSGVRVSLPPVSYTKAIDIWFNVHTIYIFLTLAEFAMVNYISRHYESSSGIAPPPQLTTEPNKYAHTQSKPQTEFGFDAISASVQTTDDVTTTGAQRRDQSNDDDETTKVVAPRSLRHVWRRTVSVVIEGRRKAKTIDLVSRVLFPVSYLIFLTIYSICYALPE